MAGTKGIIEIIIVIAVIGGAWMYRKQIMSFLESHGLKLPSGNGSTPKDENGLPYFPVKDEAKLEMLNQMSQKELEALGKDMYESYKKSGLARSYGVRVPKIRSRRRRT